MKKEETDALMFMTGYVFIIGTLLLWAVFLGWGFWQIGRLAYLAFH